jgi:hypothetical protein
LDQHSQTDDTPQSRSVLEGQLREQYGRVVYSHKTHEKCADILLERHDRIRLGQIILSAITTGGFIGTAMGAAPAASVALAILSGALLVLNSYTKKYDLGELAQKHRQAGSDLWLVREHYFSLLVDVRMQEKPLEALQAKRDELVQQLYEIYRGAPSTNYKAYTRAQEALQKLEDMTFSDAEIDTFLPKELKRAKTDTGPKAQ